MNRVGGEEVTERKSILCHPRSCTTTHTHKRTEQECSQGTAALQTPPSITHCSVTGFGPCLKSTPPHNQRQPVSVRERDTDEIKSVRV